MALSVNTNSDALMTQRYLYGTQNAMDQSLERLSSGLRINSAKDDAAGLAISTRMSAQVNGLNQAVRNANDGISLLQTSEGAMQQITNLLQSMRTIAVQASNDTNSASDRASLQASMDQYYAEIDRIAGSTQFNGINLLDGSGGSKNFQIGANAGQTISVDLLSTKTKDLHLNGYSPLGSLNSGRVAETAAVTGGGTVTGLTINGTAITYTASGTSTVAGTMDAQSEAAAINLQTGTTGVSATAYNTYRGQGNVTGVVSGLTINGNTIAASGNMTDLVSNINRDASGVTAALNSDGSLTLSNNTGANIVVGGTVTNSGLTLGTYNGYVSLSSANNAAISVTATGTSANLQQWGLNVSTGASSVSGGAVGTAALAAGDLVINGVSVGASASASAGDMATAINSVSTQSGVAASATTTQAYNLNFTAMTGAGSTNVTINGTAVNLTGATNLNSVVTDINASVKGVVASANSSGQLVLTSASGLDIVVGDGTTSAMGLAAAGGTSSSLTTHGSITLTSSTGADVNISGASSTTVAKAGFTQQGGSSEAVGSGLSVANIANANNAINRIDDAWNQVSTNRGTLGALQNRLGATISNLQNISQNLATASGRITDADFATETANFSKQQILEQAGIAMLSQAKQLPQQVLQLLK